MLFEYSLIIQLAEFNIKCHFTPSPLRVVKMVINYYTIISCFTMKTKK